MKIVFFGDSITDCDRDRQNPLSLGNGYVKILADKLRPIYPDMDIELINKGISGNEVSDLLERADEDVIDLKPDMAVCMIGINNTIHQFKNDKILDYDKFREDLEALLHKLKASVPVVIFLEPFLLPAPDKKRMRPVFAKELDIIYELALALADEYVAYDEMFNGLCVTHSYKEYSEDGVHPTYDGSLIIADQAIKAIRKHLI